MTHGRLYVPKTDDWLVSWLKVKVRCAILHMEWGWGAHLPSQGHEPVGGNTTNVCDAWPVRRQTYGYLPSRKASPPIGWYQIILFGDRGTCVLTTCPWLHSIAERPGFELATCWSQVRCPNLSATRLVGWCLMTLSPIIGCIGQTQDRTIN